MQDAKLSLPTSSAHHLGQEIYHCVAVEENEAQRWSVLDQCGPAHVSKLSSEPVSDSAGFLLSLKPCFIVATFSCYQASSVLSL